MTITGKTFVARVEIDVPWPDGLTPEAMDDEAFADAVNERMGEVLDAVIRAMHGAAAAVGVESRARFEGTGLWEDTEYGRVTHF